MVHRASIILSEITRQNGRDEFHLNRSSDGGVMEENSTTVLAIATVGFVFGLLGLIYTFIPSFENFALITSLPAAFLSLISLALSYRKKANKTFAVVAVIVSFLAVSLSCFQYLTLH